MNRTGDLADDFFDDDDRSFLRSLDRFKPKSDLLLESVRKTLWHKEEITLNFSVGLPDSAVDKGSAKANEGGNERAFLIYIANGTDYRVVAHRKRFESEREWRTWEDFQPPIEKNIAPPCSKEQKGQYAFQVSFDTDKFDVQFKLTKGDDIVLVPRTVEPRIANGNLPFKKICLDSEDLPK
jgi:hypothetical protein